MPSAPSGTSSLPTRPSSTASNSIVALSVSISARMSPECTSSPSFTSHLASLPSSMVGESAGMRISIDMRLHPHLSESHTQGPIYCGHLVRLFADQKAILPQPMRSHAPVRAIPLEPLVDHIE